MLHMRGWYERMVEFTQEEKDFLHGLMEEEDEDD